MLARLMAIVLSLCVAFPAFGRDARDDAAAEAVVATYRAFVAAQNDRDLSRVGAFFVDGPDMLWVSDGQSFWGREAILRRMALFQGAEIWRVLPNLDAARVVQVNEAAALLHFPLALEIGRAPTPSRLGFLVSLLFRKEADAWRIAALLTTEDKNGGR